MHQNLEYDHIIISSEEVNKCLGMLKAFHGYIIGQKLGVKGGCYRARFLQFLKLGSPADKL